MIKKILCLLITFSLLILPIKFVFAKGPEIDRIVVIVNDNVIMKSELDQKVSQIKQQLSHTQTQMPSDDEIRKQVLDKLIDMELELQIAKRVGIEIPDKELNQAILSIAAENHLTKEELKNSLAREGISYSDFEKQIKEQMLSSRTAQQAVGKNITVTDEEAEAYLKEHAITTSKEALFKAKKEIYVKKITEAMEAWLKELRKSAYIKIL